MSEIFKEQIVKKESSDKDNKKRIIIICLSIIISIGLFMLLGFPSIVIILIVMFISYRFINNLNKEYEYIYTNGFFDIDCIYNKAKRKRVFSGTVSNFEIMTHFNDKQHLENYSNLETKDYSSGEIYGNTYVFVSSYENKKYKFIIEPNIDILNAMSFNLTSRKLFKK